MWLWGLLKLVPKQAWLVLAVIAAILFYGHLRYNAGQADGEEKLAAYKQQVQKAVAIRLTQNGLKEAEDKRVFAEIAKKYEQDKLDAQAKSDAVIAGLRAGTIKLRKQWRGCSVATEAADGSSGVDEEAELRMQDAGAAIGDSDWADAWIEGLQEVIRQLQAGPVE